MRPAMIENDENLREIEQLKLGPMDIEELRILSDERRISIFHRGFCCGTYGVGDNFSRNFFLVQLHESGRIKIKDLARIFGMRYQYCSKIIVDYRKKGILINTVKAVNYNAEKWLQEIFKKYHTKEDETLSMIRNLCRQPGRIYQGEVALKVELQALDNGPMSESLDKVLKNLKENGWLKLPDGRNLEIVQMH
jgi:hypothetical protein